MTDAEVIDSMLDRLSGEKGAAHHWCRDTALAQIEKCDFECEAGPLKNNVAWQWLKKALDIGPKFLPGQGVYVQVTSEKDGTPLSAWGHYYVVGVSMDSDTEKRLWRYHLSNDPPAPYHYGTTQIVNISEDKLRLEPRA